MNDQIGEHRRHGVHGRVLGGVQAAGIGAGRDAEEVGGMGGMDVLRERIADVVRAHRHGTSADAYKCMCGELWTSQHVADAVIAALGLVEWTSVGLGGQEFQHYAITWERIEEDGHGA